MGTDFLYEFILPAYLFSYQHYFRFLLQNKYSTAEGLPDSSGNPAAAKPCAAGRGVEANGRNC